MTSGGYGYTVERPIAYAYLPVDVVDAGHRVAVNVFGEWVAGAVSRPAAARPEGHPGPRRRLSQPAERLAVGDQVAARGRPRPVRKVMRVRSARNTSRAYSTGDARHGVRRALDEHQRAARLDPQQAGLLGARR